MAKNTKFTIKRGSKKRRTGKSMSAGSIVTEGRSAGSGSFPAIRGDGRPFLALKTRLHKPSRVAAGLKRGDNDFRVAARYLVDGLVDVEAVVNELGLTKASLAQSLGFAEDTFQRFSRVNAPKTQQRLREFLEIMTRVEPWAGGTLQAMAWYRGQSIPALGDQTAEAMVRQDSAVVVRTYLDAYAAGAYA